jgi:hypothetical protein
MAEYRRVKREYVGLPGNPWNEPPANLPIYSMCWKHAADDPLGKDCWRAQLKELSYQCWECVRRPGFRAWSSDFRRPFEVRLLRSFADLHRHPELLADAIDQWSATGEPNPLDKFHPDRMRELAKNYRPHGDWPDPPDTPPVPYQPEALEVAYSRLALVYQTLEAEAA